MTILGNVGMCGRYSITTNPEAMRRLFAFLNATPNIRPRYNAAPTDELPIVRLDKDGSRELAMLRWGLLPSWAQDPKIGYSTINARSETVATKPAFREAFRKRRCLVPTDGFYEWAKVAGGKQPYRITLKDGEPFAMAGLWEWWRKDGQRIEAFTIIVTTANDLSAEDPRSDARHSASGHVGRLADGEGCRDTERVVAAVPASQMTMYPVSKRVGNVKNDDPELIEPAA